MEGLKEFITYLTNQLKFWFIVKEWEYGLHLRNGRIKRVLSFGIYLKIPFLDQTYSESKRMRDVVISQCNFTTKDNKSITASGAIFYTIKNILNFYNGYAEPHSILDNKIKSLFNTYFLNTNFEDFNKIELESFVLEGLKTSIIEKGFKFHDFNLTTFSNAKTYRIIKDDLYSQVSNELDKQTF